MIDNSFLGIQHHTWKKWGFRLGIALLLGVAAFMSYFSMGIAPLWVAVMVGLGSMAFSLISQKFGAFPKSKWGIGLTIAFAVSLIIVSGLTMGGIIPALSALFMVSKDTGHWVYHTKQAGHWVYETVPGYYDIVPGHYTLEQSRWLWQASHWEWISPHQVMKWVPNIVTTKAWVPHIVKVLSISKEAIAGIAIAVSSIGPVIAGAIRGVEKLFKVSAKKPIKTYSRHPQ